MTDNMENEQIEINPAENDDVLLPVGWDGVGDIFDASSWTDPATVGIGELAEEGHSVETEPSEETPATEPETSGAEQDENTEPAEQTEVTPSKLRFKTQYNHQELDVELDESELPTIYQKSLALDRERERVNKAKPVVEMAAKLAAQMGFDDSVAMLEAAANNYRQSEIDALVNEGVHKSVAEAVVNARFSAATVPKTAPDAEPEPEPEPKPEPEPAAPARDFTEEVAELMSIRPELRGKQIPDEVQKAAVEGGVRLATAYLNYEFQQMKAENERLKNTNKIHEQNAASAARAPVTGTSGGGETDTIPSDPFLIGFNSGY